MEALEKKTELLREIRDEVVDLIDSPLYAYRIENEYHAVLGEGNHDAEIIFIGEAPGETEAKTGRPFCGRAGKILDELLLHIGLKREDVYITNIVKDRPPGNRDPKPDEIALYAPYLDRQIQVIEPKVIVTLGRFSMEYIFNRYGLKDELLPISQAHGKVFQLGGLFDAIRIVPLYHPAVALYNPTQKAELRKDFEVLKDFV